MATDRIFRRARRGLALALGLMLGAGAQGQTIPASGVSYPAPGAETLPPAEPAAEPRRSRTRIQPYLEIAQVVSHEIDSGDTLTYTSVAAGVDGRVQTRRMAVQLSYRYQRIIEWNDEVGDQDIHSGLAMANVQVVPGVLNFDAGALATRTAGEGRAIGVTDRDASVEIYSAYAGPTLSTRAGPVAVNAAYRLGYVAVDDDSLAGGPREDFDSAVTHSATASVGMAPGPLPVGWTVGAGYGRTDSSGEFDHRFEGAYVRGDVVVPVSSTLAVTAGVGYEDLEASQLDLARDANGVPILGPDGRPVADPTRPRVLTYDLSGIIYDAGIIWRPSARTELQARVGYRYGGETFMGSLSHQFSANAGMTAVVYDTVSTFGSILVNDLSNLPDNFEIERDPLTGELLGCAFGADPGTGICLDRSLQSIRGNSFRLRGASLVFSGRGRLWSWGAGAGYSHRRYGRPADPAFAVLGPNEDQSFGLYASLGRSLSRNSDIGLNVFASWFDTDEPAFDTVFSAGGTASYSRRMLLDRMRLMAALGLYHSDDGTLDSTVASGLLGLRYDF